MFVIMRNNHYLSFVEIIVSHFMSNVNSYFKLFHKAVCHIFCYTYQLWQRLHVRYDHSNHKTRILDTQLYQSSSTSTILVSTLFLESFNHKRKFAHVRPLRALSHAPIYVLWMICWRHTLSLNRFTSIWYFMVPSKLKAHNSITKPFAINKCKLIYMATVTYAR